MLRISLVTVLSCHSLPCSTGAGTELDRELQQHRQAKAVAASSAEASILQRVRRYVDMLIRPVLHGTSWTALQGLFGWHCTARTCRDTRQYASCCCKMAMTLNISHAEACRPIVTAHAIVQFTTASTGQHFQGLCVAVPPERFKVLSYIKRCLEGSTACKHTLLKGAQGAVP